MIELHFTRLRTFSRVLMIWLFQEVVIKFPAPGRSTFAAGNGKLLFFIIGFVWPLCPFKGDRKPSLNMIRVLLCGRIVHAIRLVRNFPCFSPKRALSPYFVQAMAKGHTMSQRRLTFLPGSLCVTTISRIARRRYTCRKIVTRSRLFFKWNQIWSFAFSDKRSKG